MGNKIVKILYNLMFKVGCSHRLVYLLSKDIRIYYISKHLIQIKSRSIYYLKQLIYNFKGINKINAYKRKGIYIKGSIGIFKTNSKKLKI